ncbi:hypothetical protein D043_2811A, partial [Vibrio parahaemolyticus EKP-021]
MINAA